MIGKQILIVGGMAAGVFLLLTRSAKARAGTSAGRTIQSTQGSEFKLYQQGGVVRDQFGGLWV